CCITQCEAPSIWQKTAVRVGTGELAHSRLLQSLQPCGNRAKLLLQLLNGRTCHFQPGSFVGIFACALLLPAPNVLTDFGAFRSQLLQSICGPGRRVRGDARGIDGHMPQLSEPQRARQLHYLREDIVHGSPMSLAKLIQCPKIWLCASRQIAKRQIFPNALLQTPRTSDPQGVGIQPYFQQQRRMICRVSFVAVSCFKLPQIQPLHGSMHKKAKMPLSQHLSHRRWQQIRLLWVVLQKIGHPALLPSGSIDAASSPVTTQTRVPLFCVSRGNKGVTGEWLVSRGNKGVRGEKQSTADSLQSTEEEKGTVTQRSQRQEHRGHRGRGETEKEVGRSEMAQEQRSLSITWRS